MQIAFIGLGIMGSRMAGNLITAGYDLVVFNRTKDKAESLLTRGATWGGSPAETAKQAEILITMLATPEAVQQTALGDQGFLDHLQPRSIWVDCSTVNPSFSKKMASAAHQRKIRHIDAPVLGTKKPAQEGTLGFFVGGEQTDIEAIRPLLESMGSTIKHVGDHGAGVSFKMVVNLLLAQNLIMFSEAVALGRSLGFSQEILFDTLLNGPMAAPYLSVKRPKIEERIYEADFPLKWMHKDLHLATLTAYEKGIALPSTNIAKEIFALAKQAGLGDKDFSSIFDHILEGNR